MIPTQRDDPALVPFDVLAADLDGWVQRGTLRVWKRRGRLTPVACDLTTRCELFDHAAALRLEAATRPERIRRMCLAYRA